MNRYARKICFVLFAVFIGLFFVQPGIWNLNAQVANAANNGLGEKPYMGWSSYSMQVYTGNGKWITAENIKAQSDAMHEILQPYGYTYINVDAGWNEGLDEYGRPLPDPALFPNGITEVIDYVHSKGQKFGLYFIPGLSPQAYEMDLPIYGTSCTMRDIAKHPLTRADYWGLTYKIDYSNPCAQKYIDSIADLLAEWGVDFVKFDSVTPGSGVYDLSLDAREDVKAWSQALSRHGIWLELSWALDIRYADYWKQYANGWRIDWDIECYCGPNKALTKWENIARLFPKAAQWWRHAGPGGWNDFDSLNIGNGSMDGLTRDERRTAMTFWAISAAPLYIGNDMTKLDSFGIELLTNKEVIAVNQAGVPARPVSIDTDQQVWYSINEDGSYNVALFNLGPTEATVHVSWADIGLTGPAAVRDLWSHQDLGTYDHGFTALHLAPHASRLLKVVPKGGTVAVNDDDTRMRYTGQWKRNEGKEQPQTSQSLAITITDTTETHIQNSEIRPSMARFDKSPEKQSDVTVTMYLNGNELRGIFNGSSELRRGIDYTVSGNEVIVRKEYLAKQPVGTTYLTFVFSAGQAQALAVMVSEKSDDIYISVNDNDPGISYHSSWQYSWNRGLGDYMDDVHFTEKDGDYFEYTFTGTSIDIITETDPAQGEIDIYLDGQFMATVNTYSDSKSVQQVVYSITDLPIVPHTIRGVKKSGMFMLLDQLRYAPGKLINADEIEFDKAEALQRDVTVELSVDGSSLRGIAHGDSALKPDEDYTVTGNRVTLHKSYLAGLPVGINELQFQFESGASQSLRIYVDDSDAEDSMVSPATVTFIRNASAVEDLTINMTLNGNKLVGIVNGAEKLEYGKDYTLSGSEVMIKKEYLVKQEVGTVHLTFVFSSGAPQVLSVEVIELSAGRSRTVNNDDPGIMYSGSWNHSGGRGMGDYMDDVHFAEKDGDYFEYTFVGTGIAYVTELHSSQGDVEIYVDNEYKGTFSTYLDPDKGRLAQQTVYMIQDLPNGTHTLKVVKKSGSFILLDKLVVFEENLIHPDVAQFDRNPSEQDDIIVTLKPDPGNLLHISNGEEILTQGVDYTVSGNEVTIHKAYLAKRSPGVVNLLFTFQGDYLNDVHFTEVDGDFFEYTFRGTGVEWITAKGPDQGDVDIYVDDTFVQTVNTYHDNRLAGQTVFRISGLDNGVHTFKAVKKSGAYMRTDMLRFTVAALAEPSPSTGDPSISSPSVFPPVPSTARIPIYILDASGNEVASWGLIRTPQPDGSKKDEVIVSVEQVRDVIGKIAASGERDIRMVIPETEENVSEIMVQVPKDGHRLISDADMNLRIMTEYAMVTISGDDLQGFDEDLFVRFVPIKDDKEKQALQERFNKSGLGNVSNDRKGTIVGRPVEIETSLHNRKVALTLPFVEVNQNQWQDVGVFVEYKDGTRELLQGRIVTIGQQEKAGIEFMTDKFGTFALVYLPPGLAVSDSSPAYIRGYPDGLFRPDHPITRAEMATILARVVERDPVMPDIAYVDVRPNDWARESISKVTTMGLMKGYADGTFRGDQPITRAEMAVLVARLIGHDIKPGLGFTDITGHWAQDSILVTQGAGIMKGFPDGTFRPNQTLTRAEAVTIINRITGRIPSGITKSKWKDVPDHHWALQEIEAASSGE